MNITSQGRPNIQRRTLTDQTFDTLKGMILDRKFLPGEQLNISDLSKELGVSSSPLREALVRLEGQKLISQKLYCGFVVADEPSAEYLRDLVDYRIVIEGYAADIGARKKNKETLTALRAAYADMSQIHKISQVYEEYKGFIEADALFHEVIVASANNRVMVDSYRDLNVILVQSRLYHKTEPSSQRREEVMEEHRKILEAFEKGDGPGARAALEDHLLGGRRRLLKSS